jgi:hypothetical protein
LRNPLSAPNHPRNTKCIVPAFLGTGLAEKKAVCAHKAAEEGRSKRREGIFVLSSSELRSLIKNSRSKLKNQIPLAIGVLAYRPIQEGNSLADLIWMDGTFKWPVPLNFLFLFSDSMR